MVEFYSANVCVCVGGGGGTKAAEHKCVHAHQPTTPSVVYL